jgi:hypothetical protein
MGVCSVIAFEILQPKYKTYLFYSLINYIVANQQYSKDSRIFGCENLDPVTNSNKNRFIHDFIHRRHRHRNRKTPEILKQFKTNEQTQNN